MESDVLFICSTNYTILNSINTVTHNLIDSRDKSDIVIFLRNKDMIPYIKKMSALCIFNNVYVYSFINYGTSLEKIKLILLPELFLKKHSVYDFGILDFKNKSNYKVIITQSLFYSMLFKRIYSDADVYMLEEGLSSYTTRTISRKRRNTAYNLLNKILFRGLADEIKGQLLYEEEIFTGDKSTIPINKLPKIDEDETKVLKAIFGNQNNVIYHNNEVVYLGVPLSGLRGLLKNPRKCKTNFEKNCEDILHCTLRSFLKKSIIYRKHPLEKERDIDITDNICIDIENNMWELEAADFVNEDSILISFFSTAAFTPKLLYGKEPYLLFLYKLIREPVFHADQVVDGLRRCYFRPEKIMVPETITELLTLIEGLERGEAVEQYEG